MNIENLEAFIYVVHFGGFNKAAEVLFLSQPSVSARIQSLERELNCRLFDRIGKQIQITEEGRRFLPYAQQLVQTYQKGRQQLSLKKSLPGEIRIGCTLSVSNYFIPELLPRLSEAFPGTRYRIITGVTDELVQKVMNNEVDIGLVRHVPHPNLQSVKLYEDPIRLYAYEGHPFLNGERVPIEAVAEQPLVFFECGALDWLRVHRIFENLDMPPNIQIQTDNSEMAKKLVIGKAGICFLPGLCVRQEVRERRLFPVALPETEGISMQTNIISNHGEHTAFIEAILAVREELKIG